MVNQTARRRSKVLFALALGVAASAFAYAGPLAEVVRGRRAELKDTVLEVVYLGPREKPFPSVALSGGADAFDAHVAFESEFPRDFPPVGTRLVSMIGPAELGRALASIADFRSDRQDAYVGFFVIENSTKRSAKLLLDAAHGRRALTLLIDSARDAGARRDLLKLKGRIFPR